MRSLSSVAAMVAALGLWLATSGTARAVEFPQKWVFGDANVTTQQGLEKSIKDLQEYKTLGVTHVLLHESKIGRIQLANADYAGNARQYQDEAKKLGITLVPAIYALNGGSWLRLDGNLAAGIPAREMPFIVKDGSALPDPASAPPLVNGDFEQAEGDNFAGWSGQESAGKNTFADRSVKHSGNSSLKIAAGNSGSVKVRMAQDLKVKPFQYYRLSVWIKTDNLSAGRGGYFGATSSDGKRQNIWTNLQVKPTQEWTRHCLTFNTFEGTDLHFMINAGGIRGGTMWIDDLKIEPAGLLLVLRRDLTPLKVTNEDGSVTYEEGKDFKPVSDPILCSRPGGLPTYDHDAPRIVLTDSSRIKDGQKLLVSYYHSMLIYEEKEILSLDDPKTMDFMDTQMNLVSKIWPTGHYFMEYDEIRIAGWEPQPDGQKLTPGQMLARHTQKGIALVKKYAPDAKIYTWSDMYTPYHNARAFEKGGYYYMVNGTWDGSWEGLPKEVIILNWYAPTKESMKFFADRGHTQVMCGFYDAKSDAGMKKNIDGWMKMSEGLPNVVGMMYTTWENNYKDMPQFFKLLGEYPKWSTGQSGRGAGNEE